MTLVIPLKKKFGLTILKCQSMLFLFVFVRSIDTEISDSFLLQRLTQEQCRRYKRMVGIKIEHFELCQQEGCPAGSLCIDKRDYDGLGRETLKQIKYSARDRENSVELTALPPSYPVPPAEGLPSEFECPFCFKPKKCLKPSDWAKHFCEDLQPFVCTFEQCPDPKAFKRKADWIRHENERHRQLERWVCNIVDCTHICYRKDNFVQHLVREHKLPEPKPRSDSRSSRVPYYRASGSAADINKDSDSVWTLVEECREEEPKSPKDEPCKFCGTVCSSWKKLSNHLAKHMEDIAFPVWKVVLQTNVSAPDSASQSSPVVSLQPTLLSKESASIKRAPSRSDQDSIASSPDERREDPESSNRETSVPPTSSHFATVNKPFKCDEPSCTHDRGFATQTDLKRHRRGVHGIYDDGHSEQIFYRCQGKDCKDADKMWPRRDNFRGHLSRKHADEDIEELTDRYVGCSSEYLSTNMKLNRSTFRSTTAASPNPSIQSARQSSEMARNLEETIDRLDESTKSSDEMMRSPSTPTQSNPGEGHQSSDDAQPQSDHEDEQPPKSEAE